MFINLVGNYRISKRDFCTEYSLNDWYSHFVDHKSKNHFGDKAMICIDNNLKPEFKKLRECKFEFYQKMKNSLLNEDDRNSLISKLSEFKTFGIRIDKWVQKRLNCID